MGEPEEKERLPITHFGEEVGTLIVYHDGTTKGILTKHIPGLTDSVLKGVSIIEEKFDE